MPSSTASASSASVLPTPENMILSGGMPAARARLSSPAETTSAPAPRRASVLMHRLVGIRLQRVADQRRHIGERLREHAVVPFERRGRIAIERRADRARQIDEIDPLGVQHAVAIVEMVHGGSWWRFSRAGSRAGWCDWGQRTGGNGRPSGPASRAAAHWTSAAGSDDRGARRRIEPALAPAAGQRQAPATARRRRQGAAAHDVATDPRKVSPTSLIPRAS